MPHNLPDRGSTAMVRTGLPTEGKYERSLPGREIRAIEPSDSDTHTASGPTAMSVAIGRTEIVSMRAPVCSPNTSTCPAVESSTHTYPPPMTIRSRLAPAPTGTSGPGLSVPGSMLPTESASPLIHQTGDPALDGSTAISVTP